MKAQRIYPDNYRHNYYLHSLWWYCDTILFNCYVYLNLDVAYGGENPVKRGTKHPYLQNLSIWQLEILNFAYVFDVSFCKGR